MIDIFFEDNGIGFDEKYVDKIFNIFQRLEGQKYEGKWHGTCDMPQNRHVSWREYNGQKPSGKRICLYCFFGYNPKKSQTKSG